MRRRSPPVVRPAAAKDILNIARVNAAVFLGNRDNLKAAMKWVRDLFGAKDVYRYFVIEIGDEFAGYIGWQIHGGFLRPAPAVELEQLGIDPRFKGRGYGTLLSKESLEKYVAPWIRKSNNRINDSIHVFVWFRADHEAARRVYEKAGFTEPCGTRIIYGDRKEDCLKRIIPFAAAPKNKDSN